MHQMQKSLGQTDKLFFAAELAMIKDAQSHCKNCPCTQRERASAVDALARVETRVKPFWLVKINSVVSPRVGPEPYGSFEYS